MVGRSFVSLTTDEYDATGRHARQAIQHRRYRMAAMTKASVLSLLAEVDETQAELRRVLRSVPAKRLAQRPASGGWSPVENVRHLLFHEQGLQRLLSPERFSWSPYGLPPPGLAGSPRVGAAGTRPATDIGVVLREWSKIHASVRAGCRNGDATAELERQMQKTLRHLNTHLRIIQRLLRQ